MQNKITKAIIPAAGFGTRFLPATKSQPKEMLPVVDKPTIQYIVPFSAAQTECWPYRQYPESAPACHTCPFSPTPFPTPPSGQKIYRRTIFT